MLQGEPQPLLLMPSSHLPLRSLGMIPQILGQHLKKGLALPQLPHGGLGS